MENLVNLVMNAKKGTMCRVKTVTVPKMNKRNNPYYGRVCKVVEQTAQIGYNYTNAINGRLDKIGADVEFKASPRVWGKWIEGAEDKLLTHNGNLYVALYAVKNPNREIEYYIDNRPASAEECRDIIENWEIKSAPSAKQSECGLTTNQVRTMDYRADHIIFLHANNVEWENPSFAIAEIGA